VLRLTFTPIAQHLQREEETILGELLAVQGKPVEIGGYYHPDVARTAAVMRPSPTFNNVIDSLR
jgi:isocitrate dehydrogenase